MGTCSQKVRCFFYFWASPATCPNYLAEHCVHRSCNC